MQSLKIETLYKEYFDDIYRYLHKISGDAALADEITQQTFFKAMRSLHRFRGDCDVRIWLLRIAKNTFYSHKKNTARFVSFPEQAIQQSSSVAEDVEDKDTVQCILQALHTLCEPYKTVFEMRVFAELSFEQIGSAFGKNAHWACVTYHRAKEKIKQKTED